MSKYNTFEIIQTANKLNIEYDLFCLVNYIKERENEKISLEDIIIDYSNLPEY
jgi:hypothetical protein